MKQKQTDRTARYFILLAFAFLSSLAVIAGNCHAESEALYVFKQYFNEIKSCGNYDEYERVTRKYADSEMIKKMDSAEAQSLSKEFKENLFFMVKNQFFDIKELLVIEENITGNEAGIKYSRKGHPDLKGTATLIKENDIWKIKRVSETLSANQQLADKEVKPKPKNKVLTNATGLKFVLIPSGSFMMGSGIDAKETAKQYRLSVQFFEGEHPQHRVTISRPFYLQTTEVTQEQWQKVMGNNPSHFKYQCEKCPVESVSWPDTQKFIKRLNAIEGTDKYRLPTEAEWEYACRAGSSTTFYYGNDNQMLGEYAWYYNNAKGRTHPVAQKNPNSWGLYDMLGNAWEWCHDWYGQYPEGHVIDPQGPSSGKFRVSRGGSWCYGDSHIRSAVRLKLNPNARDMFGTFGFRIAKDL